MKIQFAGKFFLRLKSTAVKYSLVIFALIAILALAYAGGLFYLYAWDVQPPQDVTAKKVLVDEALYEKVMGELQQRQENFDQEEFKTYKNPFE